MSTRKKSKTKKSKKKELPTKQTPRPVACPTIFNSLYLGPGNYRNMGIKQND